MIPAIAALLFGSGAVLNLVRGNFWWGWPGEPLKRADYPTAFWAHTGFLAAIAGYCAFDAIRRLGSS